MSEVITISVDHPPVQQHNLIIYTGIEFETYIENRISDLFVFDE